MLLAVATTRVAGACRMSVYAGRGSEVLVRSPSSSPLPVVGSHQPHAPRPADDDLSAARKTTYKPTHNRLDLPLFPRRAAGRRNTHEASSESPSHQASMW